LKIKTLLWWTIYHSGNWKKKPINYSSTTGLLTSLITVNDYYSTTDLLKSLITVKYRKSKRFCNVPYHSYWHICHAASNYHPPLFISFFFFSGPPNPTNLRVREGSKFISPIASSNWTCIQHDLFHFLSLSLSLSLFSIKGRQSTKGCLFCIKWFSGNYFLNFFVFVCY